MLKQISNSLKEAFVLILILGFLKQLIYYTNFHVPIKYFLGFSDLWLIISDDLVTTAPLSILIVLSINYLKIVEMSDEVLQSKSQKQLSKKAVILFSISFGLLPLSFIYYGYTTKTFWLGIQKMSWGLVMLVLISIFLYLLFKNKSFNRDLLIIFSLLLLSSILLLKTSNEISYVQDGKYTGTIIKTTDSSYVSTNDSYFIGRTEKYFFIYNKKDTNTLIIPVESVTKLIMKSK